MDSWSSSLLQDWRRRVLRTPSVTEGFQGIDVVLVPDAPGVEGPALEVLFRWKLDPSTYAVSFALPVDDHGGTLAGPVLPADETWDYVASDMLSEELDTGLVRRADRVPRDDVIHLCNFRSPDVFPAGYFVDEVPLGPRGGGRHLASYGLAIAIPRQALHEGVLASWVQAYVNNALGRPFVGHAVVSWSGRGDSRERVQLSLVELVPRAPLPLVSSLAYAALRNAIDDGAAHLEVASESRSLLAQLGLVSEDDRAGSLLDLRQLTKPSL